MGNKSFLHGGFNPFYFSRRNTFCPQGDTAAAQQHRPTGHSFS